jgi:hypothetical protein
MSGEKNFEQEVEKNGVLHSINMDFIKSRIIPDVESMIPDVGEETDRKIFEDKLAIIKRDAEAIEKDPDGDRVSAKRIREVYDRAEELLSDISEKMPEADKEALLPPSEYLSLIKTQWIPDIKSMISDVTNKKKHDDFEKELAEIKAEMETLEKALADNKESSKQKIKEAYDRAEDLFARVDGSLPEEEEEI